MLVYHRCFLSPACVCGRGLEEGAFPACSGLAPVADVGSYVLAGVEIRIFVYFFYFYGGWEERRREETPRGEEDVKINIETASRKK